MQRCNCIVRLSGDVKNTVYKTNVTPAEIAILVAIHGEGSVVDIKPTHQDKTPHREERKRLKMIYGDKIVDATFPGEFANLPVSVSDLDLGAHEEEEDSTIAGARDIAERRAADAQRKREARAAARAAADKAAAAAEAAHVEEGEAAEDAAATEAEEEEEEAE